MGKLEEDEVGLVVDRVFDSEAEKREGSWIEEKGMCREKKTLERNPRIIRPSESRIVQQLKHNSKAYEH